MSFQPLPREALDLTWPAELDHISASSIKMAHRCEEQWRQRYVLGRKEAPNLPMLAGFADHAAVEKDMRQKIVTDTNLPIPEVQQAYLEVLEGRVEQLGGIQEVRVKDADTPQAKTRAYDEVRQSGQELVGVYSRYTSPLVSPIAVEEEFSLEVADLPVRVVGRLDLVADMLLDGTGPRIIDRKRRARGSRKIEPEWALQARVYQLARDLPHEWHISVNTSKPYVLSGEELTLPVRSSALTQRMLHQVVAKIGFLYQRYGPDEPWPATGTLHPWACGYCGFRADCWGHQ